ncbi:hypothetical protein BU16DRAFT_528356 [Lophium mytilinum]|uniref:Uncharacterized protein n=1 Tax=Lophium mytilinum TaxID=390894 RepID=A0A6A6QTH7_9PEZI|nr:hypothetical protein BU16DRAFT_528356 [Lophium mytilinum]
MPHPVHVLIFPGPGNRVPAHWALFVPSTPSSRTGKVIEVVGTPYTGYGLQFKRNYSIDTETRRHQLLQIGEVDAEHVEDMDGAGETEKVMLDIDARDALEREAKKVTAPGVGKQPIVMFEYENCQSWLKEYVAWLVKRKMLGEEAIGVLAEAPDR